MVPKKKNGANVMFVNTLKRALHRNAIDSIRPRHTNAHIILREVRFLCEEIEANEMMFWNLDPLIEEAKLVLNKDIVLSKLHPAKNQIIIKQLNICKGRREKVTYLKNYLEAELTFFEKKYLQIMFQLIVDYCDLRKAPILTLSNKIEIRSLAYSIISELIHRGISFAYLRQEVKALKNDIGKSDVKRWFAKLLKQYKFKCILLLTNVDPRVITVFMRGEISSDRIKVLKKLPRSASIETNKYGSFESISQQNTLILCCEKLKAHDRFSALFEMQNSLEMVSHYIHFNFPDREIDFYNFGLVYDPSSHHWSLIDYRDIVYFGYSRRFTKFLRNLEIYFDINFHIRDSEIAQKIHSVMSHLSFSFNEKNVINSYLNSWIALEVLFNCVKRFGKDGRRVGAFPLICEYISGISSLFYVPKLISDFCRDLEGLRTTKLINRSLYRKFIRKNRQVLDKTKFLKAFMDKKEFSALQVALSDNPYESHKAEYLSANLKDGRAIKKFLETHETNIKHHLRRLYRVRNDLVHNAATLSPNRLLNLTSLALLCFNLQEYASDVVDKILFYCKLCHPKSITDALEGIISLYDKLKISLENGTFTSEQLVNPLEN